MNGTGFLSGATVQRNGSVLPTNFVSATQLTASIAASLIAAAGSASLTVTNPGGATSSAVSFTITSPTFAITSLSPSFATAGGATFSLTVSGTGFLSGAMAQWNGSALPTTFVSATQLTASVAASLIATAGNASVTVTNPGGAASSAVSFTIVAVPQFTTLADVTWTVDN